MSSLSFSSIAAFIPNVTGKLVIAYSGGVDSHVLLHLCARQPKLHDKIVAVYINHGLQTAADDWGEHCRQQAQRLGVEFHALKVNAQADNGESPEAAARNARYRALQNFLQSGDLLLLAQHREDQMETLLLQLFRGAGVQGLAAMPASTPFGLGTMLRPLLHTAKQNIRDYAEQHRLHWVEDPSNQSSDFDRNYLRNQIVPLLKQRWPAMDKTIARAAGHCGEAFSLLSAWSGDAVRSMIDSNENSLQLAKLAQYNHEQRRWLLREWFATMNLKPPSQALLQTINQQLITARDDADPQIMVQGRYLKKYRQRLYCLHAHQLQKITADLPWEPGKSSLELGNGYRLTLLPSSAGIAQRLWDRANVTASPRRGGEKFKLPGRNGRHCLKKLYQEAGIPPWERESRPLVYLDGQLAAVPDLWLSEWACANETEACYQLIWEYAGSRN